MRRAAEVTPEAGGARIERPKAPAKPLAKPTRDHCRKQLSRLNSKYGAPRDEEDTFRLGRLLDVLQDAAESPEHVTRIVDLLEACERFPDGYMLRQSAHETRTREKRPDPSCTRCVLGWIEKPFTYRFGPQEIRTTRAAKCNCWREVEL